MPETLRQLIGRGPVDPSTALSILRQLLKALAFAHWGGVIYGNITPENIVLTSTDQATLSSSGTAYVGGEPAPTPADTSSGTSLYAAPEQINGGPVDERTDIFALGAVAYEMLTGKHPFGASEGLSDDSVIQRILHEPPLEFPQAILAGLPRQIPPILDIALSKDPKARFPDAISLLDALNGTTPAANEFVPGGVSLYSAVSPRISRSRRKLLAYLVLGVLGVAALVVVLVVTLGGNSGPSSSTTTTSEGTTSTGQPVLAITPTTNTTGAAPTTTVTATTIAPTTIAPTTTTTATPTWSEQDDSNLLYTGTWTTATADGSASGGSFLFANSSGASVSVTFEGTYLAWIAKKSPVYGEAKVTLDNQVPVTVDLYSATTPWQEKAWETAALPPGTHTVKIEWTGAKNAAATGTNISVDAFDVVGTLTQAPTP